MPPLSDNRIVGTTRLPFVVKFRSPFEIDTDVDDLFFLLYFADVLGFRYSNQLFE